MAHQVSEGVRLPDDLDSYPDQNFPASLLVPFGPDGKWQVHHQAADQFNAFVTAAHDQLGLDLVPIPGTYSAYRPLAAQIQLFRQRYSLGVGPGQKMYKGNVYHLNARMAQAAVPADDRPWGGSIHGWGLAVDFMLASGAAISLSIRNRLRPVAKPFTIADTVKSENWHWAVQNAALVVSYQPPATEVPATEPDPVFGDGGRLLIKRGDFSMDVAWIQNVLRDKAHLAYVGKSDGRFGPLTERGVSEFQQACSIPVTGVVDELTWNSLGWVNGGW